MKNMNTKHGLKNLDRSVEIFCATRPVQADILRAFQSVFQERLRLEESFEGREIRLPDLEPAKIAQGISWLAGASLADFGQMLRESAAAMLPVMAAAFPAGGVFEKAQALLLREDFDLPGACRAWLDSNAAALDDLAADAGFDPGLLRFAVEMVLGPVAALLAGKAGELLEGQAWGHGYCPVCGQHPSVGYLARPEKIDLDSLVGGGGQKHLHCSLCSHVWRFRRDACPGCGNSEPGTREMVHAGDARHERIELCHKCKGYHLSVDFREYESEPDLLIAPVSLMHLDIVARNRGGLPLYTAPWNAAA